MKLIYTKAEINDAGAINELSHQLGYKTTINDIEDRLIEILKNNDNCVFVASQNNIVVGWAHAFYSLRIESESFVEIGGLVVNENFRKKGIAKKLVDTVIDWSVNRKCNKIRVRSNSLRNEAHVFYNRIGFQEKTEQKIFDRECNL